MNGESLPEIAGLRAKIELDLATMDFDLAELEKTLLERVRRRKLLYVLESCEAVNDNDEAWR